ncbi:MAG TPA: carboxypeptidase-like regulatory domain-containing protein [Longimicrobium sp.]|nr:carboxypeptidase-like regulatory domain-containing protein [Longimicrobium sp.]
MKDPMKFPALLAPALCLALAACNDVALSVVCPDQQEPSLVVNVFDQDTGESVANEASGTFTVGGLTDSLRHVVRVEGIPQLMAFGPPGVYQVRVQRPGHAEWTQNAIRVAQADCGPATVRLMATLQPAQ